jgi:hypothetical protein
MGKRAMDAVLPLAWCSEKWIFLYLFFHNFTKINDVLKICQNYTNDVIPHGGREPNVVWYDA